MRRVSSKKKKKITAGTILGYSRGHQNDPRETNSLSLSRGHQLERVFLSLFTSGRAHFGVRNATHRLLGLQALLSPFFRQKARPLDETQGVGRRNFSARRKEINKSATARGRLCARGRRKELSAEDRSDGTLGIPSLRLPKRTPRGAYQRRKSGPKR